MRTRLVAALAVALLLSLAAASTAGAQTLRGHVPEAVTASRMLGPVVRSTQTRLAVGLPLRNQDELETFLRQVEDPASPTYRQYLTPSQFAERFGPLEEDYQRLVDFFEAHGLEVTGTHPNRMILDVRGSVADIEKVFQVNMVRWQHPERGEFFAPDREPSLDAGVAILHIAGLDNFVIPRPMNLHAVPLSKATPLTTGSDPSGLFTGGDFRAAYAPGVTLNGAGQSIGLFELDGFYAGDVTANFQQAGLPAVPVQTVLLDGFNGAPGSGNVEVILDIMMAAYMAPGASRIIVYEGARPDDVLNRMATDNLAKQLSSSWGWSPIDATTDQIFKQMVAQGQSLFQASGDSGAYKGAIMPPADDPNLTVVGGTSLTTTSSGGPWKSETTWPDSGGGVSTTWPIPSYQQSVNMSAAGGSTKMRNIPDVAMLADGQIFLICNNGQGIEVGGTSAAAPLWAGFTALANQQAAAQGKPAVGFLNPTIYKIGAGSGYANDLHDITTGNNSGFIAATGYDLATGWGTPAGQSLINDLTGISNPPGFGLSVSPQTLSVGAGASGASTINITPQNGFSGSAKLAVSGLPSGVTASFSSATAVTTSTLTLTAASSAAPGQATITITGTSGTITNTTTLVLTVTAPPSFTLAAAPATVSVSQGSAITSTITITPQNNFNGTVALSASGLPSGVTSSFSAVNASGASTLTLTAAASAALGTANITISGTSGSLHATTTLGLTVSAAPNFTIAAAPSSLSVPQGGSGASTITVTPAGAFNGAVALALTGLPSGITAAFSPASTAHTSTLTFNIATSAAPGTSTVTVTGTSGTSSSKTSIAITVPAQPSFTLSASPAGISLNPGSSAASTIVVSGQNGFAGSVTLSASGIPAGVTASFGSSTTKTSSSVTLSATSSAAPGSYSVTITGTSGNLTAKVTLALTVTPPPSFSLSATPGSLSIGPGASGASTIAINAQNGFAGTVALAASGLPSGVTVAFSPASTAAKSVVTFTAAATAAPATATVTIAGTSGTLIGKTTVILTVTAPPAFTLSASPASLSIAQGSKATSTLTLTPSNGFSGAVTVGLGGLPSGVAATFSPGSTPTTLIVTLTAGATAAPGNTTVTITGTSGSLSRTATLGLTVAASATAGTTVNMSTLYNVAAEVTDGSIFTSGGLDAGGRAYSASQLGASQTVGATAFSFGPANAPGAVSSATIPLPAGQYSTLKLLATAVNGNQTSQVFTVTYTDGSKALFTQSLSDWCTPQSYAGESEAIPMTYRDNSDGTRDTRPLALYGYSFSLNSGKTVSAITLPKNRNVVVLGMNLGK